MRFKAIETFKDAKLKSVYKAGLSYTVQKGNKVLKRKVSEWVTAGKVELLPEDPAIDRAARIAGKGAVQ